MSVRTERVASLIRHELGTIISRDYSGGELGFSTVTEVRVTPDLKLAKIYISILRSTCGKGENTGASGKRQIPHPRTSCISRQYEVHAGASILPR